MCLKKIKDILFPFNIFGKDKKCVIFKIPDSIVIPYTIDIWWTGDRLQETYSYIWTNHDPVPRRLIYTDGNNTHIQHTGIIPGGLNPNAVIMDNKIYFNCTNVTRLNVNGVDLI